jgi:predicted ATP-dependent endonuclease of OLD family
MARKLLAKRNNGLPFAERVILAEGQDDVDVVHVLAERLSLPTTEANVAVADCGGKTNLPDYSLLCRRLGIPHLVVMDADASKGARDAHLAKRTQAVRDAVAANGGELIEFAENIETAFGLEHKDHERLIEAADSVDPDLGEPGELSAALRRFLPPGGDGRGGPGSARRAATEAPADERPLRK